MGMKVGDLMLRCKWLRKDKGMCTVKDNREKEATRLPICIPILHGCQPLTAVALMSVQGPRAQVSGGQWPMPASCVLTMLTRPARTNRDH